LRGNEIEGWGVAITEQDALSEAFHAFFRLSPSSAKFFKVKLDEEGVPDQGDLERILAERVMVKINIHN
jgi:hypothetical protein